MKKLLISLLLIFTLLPMGAQNDSLTFVEADWHWQSLKKGAEAGYAQIPILGGIQSISIVRYPARRFHTQLLSSPGPEAAHTDSLAVRNDALFALNGSYFGSKLEPVTYFCIDGEVLGRTPDPETSRCDGLVAVPKKNGRSVEIARYDAGMEDEYPEKYYAALASGPLFLLDGEVCGFDPESKFNKTRHPRSFIGLNRDGDIYLVVVDGRFKGQADGASISELVQIARWLGLSDALNLDGGGSSAVWTSETGIINYPCDNKKFDHAGVRTVPNAIIVR